MLVRFRRPWSVAPSVLPWVFATVLFTVVGVSVLRPSANLPVATAAGLLLAWVMGSLADWLIFWRKSHPRLPNAVPEVFTTVFLLALGVGVINAVLSPAWYRSTARLRLRRAAPDRGAVGNATAGFPVFDPQLVESQRDVIRSENTLRSVIDDLDLNRQWGWRYSGGSPLPPSWTLAYLKRRIEVRRIPGTCLIEIRVWSEKPEEVAKLANALAETYRKHQRDQRPASLRQAVTIEAEILDHAIPPSSPVPYNTLNQLSSWTLIALCLAFAAGGGVSRVLSQMLGAHSSKLLGP